jgi:G3E family GTPase
MIIIITKKDRQDDYCDLWYLDLLAAEPLIEKLRCHRVAIMPPELHHTGIHAWADEVIPGNHLETVKLDRDIQIDRGVLTGEILDFASLESFWYELIEGAYGEVIRVKGIFDIMDGQSIYGQFLSNFPAKDFQPLNLPRWTEGRPQRFSGLEIIGRNLVREQIAQTLEACCLSESAIQYYQQQMQESLATTPI